MVVRILHEVCLGAKLRDKQGPRSYRRKSCPAQFIYDEIGIALSEFNRHVKEQWQHVEAGRVEVFRMMRDWRLSALGRDCCSHPYNYNIP